MRTILQIFWEFLKLGCSSFGGPIAHLMYFRQTFVEKLKWLNDKEYQSIVTLSQSLPGPASSQVGFTIGLLRGGIAGAFVAFIAFTLPSVILLIVFANYLYVFDSPIGKAALQGLAILAFVVVSQGLLGMAKGSCNTKPTFLLALASFVILLSANSLAGQFFVILLGAMCGAALLANDKENGLSNAIQEQALKPRRANIISFSYLCVFTGLFFALPYISETVNIFYRSGALVFGGGHVVLPLLESATVANDLLSQEKFLAGYGATQAMPGPMFSFAAYLGFIADSNTHILGSPLISAFVAAIAIFIPGFLLILIILPHLQRFYHYKRLQGALAGANASVVGLLAAALYDPIFLHAINSGAELGISAVGLALLMRFKLPVFYVIVWCVVATVILKIM
uniref:chromate efflux transporter n=1 Tax=Ningiella ruwaisensis TaxID=2364274 RepID=UPI00109FCFEF|nr:chromate efflux transporter [Ningiella ruwaisensis]